MKRKRDDDRVGRSCKRSYVNTRYWDDSLRHRRHTPIIILYSWDVCVYVLYTCMMSWGVTLLVDVLRLFLGIKIAANGISKFEESIRDLDMNYSVMGKKRCTYVSRL